MFLVCVFLVLNPLDFFGEDLTLSTDHWSQICIKEEDSEWYVLVNFTERKMEMKVPFWRKTVWATLRKTVKYLQGDRSMPCYIQVKLPAFCIFVVRVVM